jgi:hypothetical protein
LDPPRHSRPYIPNVMDIAAFHLVDLLIPYAM